MCLRYLNVLQDVFFIPVSTLLCLPLQGRNLQEETYSDNTPMLN